MAEDETEPTEEPEAGPAEDAEEEEGAEPEAEEDVEADEDAEDEPHPIEETAAARLLRKVPPIAGLPGPAVALIGLGISAFAALILLDVVGLMLSVVYRGLGGFLTVLLIAMITAYLLDPVIDRFEKAGWSRTRAIGVSLSLFLAFDAVVLLLLIPYVVSELTALTGNVDNYVQQIGTQGAVLEGWLEKITGREEIDLGFASLARELPLLAEKLPTGALDPLGTAVQVIVGWFGGVFGFLFQWALFPVFVFFFLRDWDEMKRGAFELVPNRWREQMLDHYVQIDQKMAQFLRGQFMLCCALAALYATGLAVFTDIPLGVLVGVVAGLLFIIPYFGTFIGILAGTALAFLEFGFSAEIIKVWVVFGVVQGIEGAFLTPKIVGDSVGLHPVVVMLSLVVGANLFGFLGILLGVPVAAALQVLLASGVARYRGTDWFKEGAETAPTGADVP